jgi:hypothetical protein
MIVSMTTKRRMSYDEFVAGLPDVLDDLARADETVLIEKNGRTFSVEVAEPEKRSSLPPLPPLEERLRILKETAGGFHTPDREKFLEELRLMRQQDSEGRPA